MQKNIKILFSSLLFMLILFLGSSSSIYAAEEGTMFSNAVNITFGKQYYKGWATRSDHLNHYCKIQVPQKGIVTINASKPFDSEGEYGELELILYNSNNIPIWGSDTYYSVKGASDNYNFKVGLEAGTYYLTIRPTFYVKSGILSTSYRISYQKTDYCTFFCESYSISVYIKKHSQVKQQPWTNCGKQYIYLHYLNDFI